MADFITGQAGGAEFCLTSVDGTIAINPGVTAAGKPYFDISSGITLNDLEEGSIPANAVAGCPPECGGDGTGDSGSKTNPYIGFSGDVYVSPASAGFLHLNGSGANGGQLQYFDGSSWLDAAEIAGVGLVVGNCFTDGQNAWVLESVSGTPGQPGYSEVWSSVVLPASVANLFQARGTVCTDFPVGLDADGRPTFVSPAASVLPVGYVNWDGVDWFRWDGISWSKTTVRAPGFFWAEAVCDGDGTLEYCKLYTLCPQPSDCPGDAASGVPVEVGGDIKLKVVSGSEFVWLEYDANGNLCVRVNWSNVDEDALVNDPEFCAELVAKLVGNNSFTTQIIALMPDAVLETEFNARFCAKWPTMFQKVTTGEGEDAVTTMNIATGCETDGTPIFDTDCAFVIGEGAGGDQMTGGTVNRIMGDVFDCITDYALSSDFPSADAGLLFDLSGGTLTIQHTAPPNDATSLGGVAVGTTGTDTVMSASGVQQFKVTGDGGAQLVFSNIVDDVFQNSTMPSATWVKNLNSSPVVAAPNVAHNVTITIEYTDGETETLPVKLDTRYREPAGGGGGNMPN